MKLAPVAGLVAAGALVWFAGFGGEYSTPNYLKLKAQLAAEHDSVAALEHALDSLAVVAHDLETSPAAQERAAREQFGMIKNGELLYRLVPRTDSTRPPR